MVKKIIANAAFSYLLTCFGHKRLWMSLSVVLFFAGCESASEHISGTYEATLAAPSSPGRILELQLEDDQRATLTIDFLNEQASVVQQGTWARHEQDSLTIYIIEQDDKLLMDTLQVQIQGSQLVLKDATYGVESVRLLRRNSIE
jgi:hypothetical protein